MTLIIFDLDGTLTDPFEGIGGSIRYALEALGVPVPDDDTLRSYVGPPLMQTFRELVGAEQARHALTLYREALTMYEAVGDRASQEIIPIDCGAIHLHSAGLASREPHKSGRRQNCDAR